MDYTSENYLGPPGSDWLRQLFPGEHARLVVFADSLVNDEETAEEIVYQALFNVMQQMVNDPLKFPSYDEMKYYLYKAVRFACYDKGEQRRFVTVEEEDMALSLSDQGKVVRDLELADMRQVLIRMINRLSPKLKEVATLLYVDRLTPEEAAAVLHMERNQFYVYTDRAKKQLIAMLVDKEWPITPRESLLILAWLATQC